MADYIQGYFTLYSGENTHEFIRSNGELVCGAYRLGVVGINDSLYQSAIGAEYRLSVLYQSGVYALVISTKWNDAPEGVRFPRAWATTISGYTETTLLYSETYSVRTVSWTISQSDIGEMTVFTDIGEMYDTVWGSAPPSGLTAIGTVFNGIAGPSATSTPRDWVQGYVDVVPYIPLADFGSFPLDTWTTVVSTSDWSVNENYNRLLIVLQKWKSAGGKGAVAFSPGGTNSAYNALLTNIYTQVSPTYRRAPDPTSSAVITTTTKTVSQSKTPYVYTPAGTTTPRVRPGDTYSVSHSALVRRLCDSTGNVSTEDYFTVFFMSERGIGRVLVDFRSDEINHVSERARAIIVSNYGSVVVNEAPIYEGDAPDIRYDITTVENTGVSSYTISQNGIIITSAYPDSVVTFGIALESPEANLIKLEIWYVVPGTDGERTFITPNMTSDLTGNFTMPGYPVFIKAYTDYDPNDQSGESGEGGGDGEHDDTTDDITTPTLPPTGITESGFISIYRMTVDGLNSLADYLWTNFQNDGMAVIIETIQKVFQNPMQMMISLGICPSRVPASTSKTINFGGIFPTSVSGLLVDSQWVDVNCGTINIKEYWGSFLDYTPFTTASLFLPYVGTVNLDIDQIMGHSLGVRYRYDCLTGTGVAFVTIDGSVRYQFTAQCLTSIPLTGENHAQILSSVLGAIGTGISVGGLIGGGGAAAVAAGRAVSSVGGGMHISDLGTGLPSGPRSLGLTPPSAGALPEHVGGTGETVDRGFDSLMRDVTSGHRMGSEAIADMNAAIRARSARVKARYDALSPIQKAYVKRNLVSSVGNVMLSKPSYQYSGSMGAASGLLGVQKPFLIIKRPRQSLAENYKHFNGYPSNMTKTVGSCMGYTEYQEIDLTGIPCTSQELGMIYDQLKGGFYP